MSDIIKDAKELLDGATPGPWEWEERKYRGNSDCHHDWLGSEHGTALVTFDSEEYSSWVESADSDKTLIAAAPELAQAVAEETWEYIVQVKLADRWQFYIGESRLPTNSPGLAVGFSQKKHAEEFAKAEFKRPTSKHPTRIVRRRISAPEVINE